jgi:ubiquinone/menaquinone biosynthesis C-methylase UbiE
LPGVDVVANLEAPLPFLSDSVQRIYSKSVLEHVHQLELVMAEIHRVVEPGGDIHIRVPHFSSPLSFSDYTHKRFFGYYSFDYLVPAEEQRSRRKVPSFYTDFKFRIVSKRLQFVSYFPPLRPLMWLCEKVFNAHEELALLYESTLCYIVPCYAIEFRLTPLKPTP